MKKKTKKLPVGFKEFLIKTGVLAVIFVILQLVLIDYIDAAKLPGGLKIVAFDDIAEAALFILVLFIALRREWFLKIKSYSVGYKERALAAVSVVIGFVLYFSYKKSLLQNLTFVENNLYLVTIGEFILLLFVLLSLITFVYGLGFLIDFFRAHKRSLGYSFVGVFIVYYGIRLFQYVWDPMSNVVAGITRSILGNFGSTNLSYLQGLPFIYFEGFFVGIAKTCSGIDSVLLFTGLFIAMMVWDWKVLDKKRAGMVYVLGILFVFFLNILRIVALIMIGAYYSREFALQTFHTNASSLLFLIYFALLMKFGYRWMKKKPYN